MLGPFHRGRPFTLSLTRVRATRERAGRIEKVGKLRVTRETGEAPTRHSRRRGVPITRHRNSEGACWYLENDAPYLRRTEGTSDTRGKGSGGGRYSRVIRKEAYKLGVDDAPVPRAEQLVRRRGQGRARVFR